jgi:methionine-rich copper-binding protein CopC
MLIKSASKTGLVDSSAEAQKALKDEMDKINKLFGEHASAEFPTFKFTDEKLEPISSEKLDKVEIR